MTIARSANVLTVLLLLGAPAAATEERMSKGEAPLPEVASRTYAQNYKDLALAACIAQAYTEEPKASADAGATAGGLQSTWTNYDAEAGAGEISSLVSRYLSREYQSIHGPEIRLDLFKCLDMYHSKELDDQVRRLVPTPERTWQQDYAPER